MSARFALGVTQTTSISFWGQVDSGSSENFNKDIHKPKGMGES